MGEGKRANLIDERIDLGQVKAKSLESAGLDVFALEKAGVGVAGAAGEAGVGGADWTANFL